MPAAAANQEQPYGPDMPTTAVVLAGGLGTRLRAAVAGRPKVLAPVAGEPFLHYLLSYLKQQGLTRVVLSTGYLADQVQAYVGTGEAWGLQVECLAEPAPLGTAGALRFAAQGMCAPFFALNGDTLFAADLPALWAKHLATGALATVALLRVDSGQARGCVTLCEDGKVLSFDEKPEWGGPALINAGVYVLTAEALASVPAGQPVSIEREVFPELAARDQLAGLEQNAYFADIGTPESLTAFEGDVLAGRIPFIKPMDTTQRITASLQASARLLDRMAGEQSSQLAAAAAQLSRCLNAGRKVLICGNGGSAADAQHFAGELMGRFRRERQPLPALALTADTTLLTAVGNDYGFEQVFARQVKALAAPGDLVIGITTSGKSPNVLAALKAARTNGAGTMALCGEHTAALAPLCDRIIAVPSGETPRIQEAHAAIIHILCDIVEGGLQPHREAA